MVEREDGGGKGGGKGWWEGMWQMMALMGGGDGIDGRGAVVCAGPGMPVCKGRDSHLCDPLGHIGHT